MAARAARIAALRSREPSSTAITSNSTSRSSSRVSKHASRYWAALYTGITTLSSGLVMVGSVQ